MKRIKVKYISDLRDEEGVEFEIPEELIYSADDDGEVIRLPSGLDIYCKFEYYCSRCHREIKQVGAEAGFSVKAWLTCKCGEWTGKGNSYGGNWQGSPLKYRKYTAKELKDQMKSKIEDLKNEYEKLLNE